MITALRERFGSDQQSDVHRIQLRNRRRGTHERLSDLMQDIRRLMVLAYSSTTSPMWESVASNAFLDALGDPVLALKIRKRGSSTLDGVYREALLLEGFMKSTMPSGMEPGKSSYKANARAATASKSRSDERTEVTSPDETWRRELLESQQKLQEHIQRQAEQIQYLLNRDSRERIPEDVTTESRAWSNQRQGNHQTPGQTGDNKTCFNCGGKGHYVRNCPYLHSGPTQGLTSTVNGNYSVIPAPVTAPKNLPARNRLVCCANTAYMPVVIDGKKRWRLLDSGSQATIVPSRLVEGHKLVPSDKVLTAANGTEIRVSGETTLHMILGEWELLTECVVSDFVDKIMLGLDWLEENECIWNFGQRTITFKDSAFQLYAHKPTWGVRRIILSEPAVMKPRTQQNVKADVVFANLAPSVFDWVTQSSEPQSGIRVARTVVDNQASQVVVRMINNKNEEIQLSKGMPLCRLEKAVVMPETSSSNGSDHQNENKHLEELIPSVDETVSANDVARLRNLLYANASAFSTDDFDLGRTSQVLHRIDTGNNKLVRQSLRRQPITVLQTIDKQLDDMQKAGIIKPVQSAWASNIVIVKKKDGSARFCVDYRGLNDRTIKDSYPLPRIDDCLDEEFEFEVLHRPGRQHGNADALSRRPCRQCGRCDSENTAVCQAAKESRTALTEDPVNKLVLAQMQQDDEDIGPIYQALLSSRDIPEWKLMLPYSQATKIYWTKWNSLEILDGVMYIRINDDSDTSSKLLLVAPKSVRGELISQAHAGFTGGHLGQRRTLEQVRRRAYWVGWTSEVRRYVQCCCECARYKRGNAPRQGPMQIMQTGEP